MTNGSLFARAVRGLKNRLRFRWQLQQQRRALTTLAGQRPKRIIVGSSGTRFPGWVATDRQNIDLLRESTWARYFEPNTIDAILAEHVWEHLSASQGEQAARNCFRFLAPGGYLRVAVPDGLHVDPAYVEAVRPGGTGAGSDDHKVLYDHRSLRTLFERAGFEVRLYEYFDDQGRFHFQEWNPADGMVERSMRFDPRNSAGQLNYTSVVIDAVKPHRAPSP